MATKAKAKAGRRKFILVEVDTAIDNESLALHAKHGLAAQRVRVIQVHVNTAMPEKAR